MFLSTLPTLYIYISIIVANYPKLLLLTSVSHFISHFLALRETFALHWPSNYVQYSYNDATIWRKTFVNIDFWWSLLIVVNTEAIGWAFSLMHSYINKLSPYNGVYAFEESNIEIFSNLETQSTSEYKNNTLYRTVLLALRSWQHQLLYLLLLSNFSFYNPSWNKLVYCAGKRVFQVSLKYFAQICWVSQL